MADSDTLTSPGKTPGSVPGSFFRSLVLTRKRRPGLALWLLLLLALYGLGVGLALPHFAKPYLEKNLSADLGVDCVIHRLTVNPFTLKIIARGVEIPYPDSTRDSAGDHFLRLARLELTPSPRSLANKTLVVEDLRLVRPRFAVSRFIDGTLSPQVFFPDAPPSQQDDDDFFPLVIHNITVENGTLDIADALHGTAYAVTELNLSVPFASTLRTDRDVALTPSLTAVVNGKPLSVSGESRPFDKTRRTIFRLRTEDLNLPDFDSYIRPYTSLSLKSGLLHTELTLRFAQDAEQAFDFALAGTVEITDLALADKRGTVLTLARAAVEAENVVLGPRRVVINHALLEKPEVTVRRAKDGSVDWAGFFTLPEDLPQQDVRITTDSGIEMPLSGTVPGTAMTAPPLQLVIKKTRVTDGKVVWHDATTKTPVRYVAEGITGTFSDVSSEDAGRADFSLAFGNGNATASATGRATVNPMRVEGSLDAKNLALAPFYPYLPEGDLSLEGGSLSVSGDFVFQYAPEPVAHINGGKTSLAGLKAHVGGKKETPLASIQRVTADKVTADLVRRTLRVGSVAGTGLVANLTRNNEGQLVLPAFTPSKPAAQKTEAPWKIAVDSLAVTQSGVSFTDDSLRRQVAFSLTDIEVKGGNFANYGDNRWDITASGKPGGRGKLALSARGTLAPLNLRFSGEVEKTDMRPFSQYLRQACSMRLSEGTLGADFTGSVKRVPGSERGGEFAIKGNVGAYGVSLVHKRQELGGWGRLRVTDIDYRVPSSGGRTCSIGAITVNNPRLAVTIDERGVSTLATALEPPDSAKEARETGGTTQDTAASKDAARDGTAAPPAFASFSVGEAVLSHGQAAYRDMRVSPPYALKVSEVNASASSISLDPAVYTPLVGKLMVNGAPVSVSAVVQGLFSTPAGSGALSVRSLDLSRFTQYAEKYLGYSLARGELTLSAIASLRGRDLAMNNSVLIRGLDLGKKVQSPHAPDMPLSAAVGLLRDGNGDISLELPVAGTIGDPEFKLGGVVGKVIGSVILKTVTSPFALVGGLVSGFIDLLSRDGPASTQVVFPMGENTLDTVAKESLEALGKELRKHPRAVVTITGMADMGEKNLLVDAWVNKALKRRKYNALPTAEKAATTLENVPVGPEHNAREYSRLLFAFYKSLPFVKKSKDPEVTSPQSTRAVMRILRSRSEIGEDELRALARSRAVAVYHALCGGNIDIAARLRIEEPVLQDAEETKDRIASYARMAVIR